MWFEPTMHNHTDNRRDDAPSVTAKDGHGARTLVSSAVTINRPVPEVYRAFRNLSTLPTFMENIERVDMLDDQRSRWTVRGPGGTMVHWDARITEEIENQSLTWQSEEGADIENSGRVLFQDGGARGTIVTATIAYKAPGGTIGKLVAKLLQREPSIQTRRDLRRFKQLLETGEIATSARNRADADRPIDQGKS
jgi:uncharacterized membrane protein